MYNEKEHENIVLSAALKSFFKSARLNMIGSFLACFLLGILNLILSYRSPFIGNRDQLEKIEEYRIEMVVKDELVKNSCCSSGKCTSL